MGHDITLPTILTGRNLPKIRQSREPEPVDHQRKDDRGFYAVVEQYASHMEPTACRSSDVERPSPDSGSLFIAANDPA
jgi:hypothetical protein